MKSDPAEEWFTKQRELEDNAALKELVDEAFAFGIDTVALSKQAGEAYRMMRGGRADALIRELGGKPPAYGSKLVQAGIRNEQDFVMAALRKAIRDAKEKKSK